jgi:hypothetical protein
MIGLGLGNVIRIEAAIYLRAPAPVILGFPFPCPAALGFGIDPRCLRAYCSPIGFTEWPHQNQTLTKFRG